MRAAKAVERVGAGEGWHGGGGRPHGQASPKAARFASRPLQSSPPGWPSPGLPERMHGAAVKGVEQHPLLDLALLGKGRGGRVSLPESV